VNQKQEVGGNLNVDKEVDMGNIFPELGKKL
jgi:hypothetical protein